MTENDDDLDFISQISKIQAPSKKAKNKEEDYNAWAAANVAAATDDDDDDDDDEVQSDEDSIEMLRNQRRRDDDDNAEKNNVAVATGDYVDGDDEEDEPDEESSGDESASADHMVLKAKKQKLTDDQKKSKPVGERTSHAPTSGATSDKGRAADQHDVAARTPAAESTTPTSAPKTASNGGVGATAAAAAVAPTSSGPGNQNNRGVEEQQFAKFASEADERDGRVYFRWLMTLAKKRAKESQRAKSVTVDDISRYMRESRATFDMAIGALLVEYSKSTKQLEMRKVALKAIERLLSTRVMVQGFDAMDKDERTRYLRSLSVDWWKGQKNPLPIPPAKPGEDPDLNTEPVEKSECLNEGQDSADLDSDSFERRRGGRESKRAEAQRVNKEREAAYAALEHADRIDGDYARMRVVRHKLLTAVSLSLVLPYLPRTASVSFRDAQVCGIYFSTPKGFSLYLTDKDGMKSYYQRAVIDEIIAQRCTIPLDGHIGVVDALEFGFHIAKRTQDTLVSQHEYTREQASLAVKAVGEAFYYNDPPANKRRALLAAFGWAPDDDSWLEWHSNPGWLEVIKSMPDREARRAGSRSEERVTFYTAVANLATQNFPALNISATPPPPPAPGKQRKKPPTRPAPTAAAAAAAASSSVAEPPTVAPAPASRKKSRKENPKVAELTTELAKETLPTEVAEARIADGTLFFIDTEHAPDERFDQFRQVVAEVAAKVDAVVRVRTKTQAADTFSIATQESNTTSAQRRGGGGGEDDDDDADASEQEANGAELQRSDFRRVDKIAQMAAVPIVSVYFEFSKQIAPEVADGIKNDFPELHELTEEERVRVREAALELRKKSRARVNTTKKAALTLAAQRSPKVAHGILTKVDPHSKVGVHGGVVHGHELKQREAPETDALARAPTSKSWLLREIALDAIAGDTASVINYAYIIKLRNSLRAGGRFEVEDRIIVVINEVLMPTYGQYVIREMHRAGKLFADYIEPDVTGDPVRALRTAVCPGSGFATWAAKMLVMQYALSILGRLARETVSKKETETLLAAIPEMTPPDFSPLTMWTPNPEEKKPLPVEYEPTEEELAPIRKAFIE